MCKHFSTEELLVFRVLERVCPIVLVLFLCGLAARDARLYAMQGVCP